MRAGDGDGTRLIDGRHCSGETSRGERVQAPKASARRRVVVFPTEVSLCVFPAPAVIFLYLMIRPSPQASKQARKHLFADPQETKGALKSGFEEGVFNTFNQFKWWMVGW